MNTFSGDSLLTNELASVDYGTIPTGDSTSHREYWVSHIVHNMEGCSPGRIDSVIQAHLHHPVIHWSERIDTLSIPGVEWHSVCDINRLPVCYKQSFFQDNPHYHPELPFHSYGYIAEPLPYRLWRDDILSSLLLLIFVLLLLLINRTRSFIREQSHDFLFTPHMSQTFSTSVTTSLEYGTRVFLTFVLSMVGGLCFFSYIQMQYTIFMGQLSPYFLLGLYTVCFLLFFSTKRLLLNFVNWVFFDKIKRHFWNQSYNFLYMVETLLLLPIIAIYIYFSIPTKMSLLAILFVVVLVKVMLLYKSYQIFFPKIYGILHLLSYLCALEIMPLVALWALLSAVTDNMIVKF